MHYSSFHWNCLKKKAITYVSFLHIDWGYLLLSFYKDVPLTLSIISVMSIFSVIDWDFAEHDLGWQQNVNFLKYMNHMNHLPVYDYGGLIDHRLYCRKCLGMPKWHDSGPLRTRSKEVLPPDHDDEVSQRTHDVIITLLLRHVSAGMSLEFPNRSGICIWAVLLLMLFLLRVRIKQCC